ncbi:hypothetical protein CSUI_004870, partial [Cystoisospora suis]
MPFRGSSSRACSRHVDKNFEDPLKVSATVCNPRKQALWRLVPMLQYSTAMPGARRTAFRLSSTGHCCSARVPSLQEIYSVVLGGLGLEETHRLGSQKLKCSP